jgi:hypothetical protein
MGFITLTNGQRENPFNIYHVENSVPRAVIIEDVIEEETSNKLEGENPFNISHIPIRKNQYKQIEQLTTRPGQEKENISIAYSPLWILAISLCFLAYIFFIKKSHLMSLLRSLSNDNFLKMMHYEQNGGRSAVYFLGYSLFLINFALFLYLVAQNVFNARFDTSLAFIFLGVTGFFIGKHIVIALVSWVFEFQKEAQLYNFTIITIRNILAIIFLTINILFVFGPSIWSKALAIIGAFFFVIFLISRYYKGIKIGRRYVNNNVFHFFLYFCAFELSPWVIIYKLAHGI